MNAAASGSAPADRPNPPGNQAPGAAASGAPGGRTSPVPRLALASLSLAGLLLTLFMGHLAASDGFAFDGHAYWAARGYGITANDPDAFLYSPPALLLFRALGGLPWEAWLEGYSLLMGAGIWVLAGPFSILALFTAPVASELTLANIHVFLALVAVFGLRWPALWSVALLTKVTPGVGILWFVARREWRSLGIALGATALIAVPTMLLAPDLWAQWLGVLGAGSRQADGGPLFVRLPIAAALVWLGARRDWPWLVPIASMLALPVLWSVHGLSMLIGPLWYAHRWLWRRAGGGDTQGQDSPALTRPLFRGSAGS